MTPLSVTWYLYKRPVKLVGNDTGDKENIGSSSLSTAKVLGSHQIIQSSTVV